MKKVVRLAACLMFASALAFSAQPDSMKQALELYNTKKYADAYKILEDLFSKKMGDAEINFYLGRCALELKKYDEALAAFERVLIKDPNHVRTYLELGRTYFEQKQFDDAQEEFEKALKFQLPPDVKAQVEQYLSAISDAMIKHTLNGAVIFGAQYDSNYKNGIGNKYYEIPLLSALGAPATVGEPPRMDYSATQVLALNHNYNFGYKIGPYWSNALVLFNQENRQNSAGNVRMTMLNSALGYKQDRYDISTFVGVDRLWYGFGLPILQHSASVGVKGNYKLTETLSFESSGSLKNKYNDQINKVTSPSNWQRNSLGVEFSTGLKQTYKSGTSVGIGATYTKEMEKYNDNEATSGGATDVNNYSRSFKFDLLQPVVTGLDLTLAYTLKQSGTSETDGSFFEPKKELSKTISLGVSHTVKPGQIVTFAWTSMYNSSNFANLIYQKNTAVANYIIAF